MLPCLGIRLPRNRDCGQSAGRGIIERLKQTIGMTIARQFETAMQPVQIRNRSQNPYAVNSLANAKGELTPLQRKA